MTHNYYTIKMSQLSHINIKDFFQFIKNLVDPTPKRGKTSQNN